MTVFLTTAKDFSLLDLFISLLHKLARKEFARNLTSVGRKMTELALPPWRDWIFGSFEDKSSDLEVRCYGLYQVTVPMHAGGHDDFVDSTSVTLRPSTVALLGTQDICMPVLEVNLRLGEFTQEKLQSRKGTFLR